MASGLGTAELDFGSHPGASEASVAVTGQSEISASSNVEAYVMADDTSADHTASDHRYFAVLAGLSCGALVAGTGFTIYARALDKLTGRFTVRYIWSD